MRRWVRDGDTGRPGCCLRGRSGAISGCRGRLSSEYGQTLVIVSVWLVVCLLVAALVLDLARLQVVRMRLQQAAEAGSLAAVAHAERQEEGHWKDVWGWVWDPDLGEWVYAVVGKEWVVDREWAEILDHSVARREAEYAVDVNVLPMFPLAVVRSCDVAIRQVDAGTKNERSQVDVTLLADCATFLIGPVLGGDRWIPVKVSASSQAKLAKKGGP